MLCGSFASVRKLFDQFLIMKELEHLNDGEKLQVENAFMKLKIMAEHGGEFYGPDTDENLPVEIENEFLSNIIEYEQRFADRKMTTVFEKIGKPERFLPANEIPDEKIADAWEELSAYMSDYGVELSACSPKVTARELYRFTVQELFNCETVDIDIPGMMTAFIYDEFYPDHEYENTRAATDNCMKLIFNKRPLEWIHHFADELRFNDRAAITGDELRQIINQFKDAHDDIELDKLRVDSTNLKGKHCAVNGNYAARAKSGTQVATYRGNWLVEFICHEDLDYWYIRNLQIEGISF